MKLYDDEEIFSPEIRKIGRCFFWALVCAAFLYLIIPGVWMIVTMEVTK